MEMSKTQLSNYAKMITGIIMLVLPLFGVVADEAQITFVIFAILMIGFTAYSFYQRFKKGDLTLSGIRK